jgi:hypothetical protein
MYASTVKRQLRWGNVEVTDYTAGIAAEGGFL